MNQEQFERLDRCVGRIVRAHNLRNSNAVDEEQPVERIWNQGVWAEGVPDLDTEIDKDAIEVDNYVPDSWYSDAFVPLRVDCGTSCCLAGDGVIEAGGLLVVPKEEAEDEYESDGSVSVEYAVVDGVFDTVRNHGMRVFGLNGQDAEIFSGGNNARIIVEAAQRIAGRNGFALSYMTDDLR